LEEWAGISSSASAVRLDVAAHGLYVVKDHHRAAL
jgi:hypothetical protein